MAEFSPVFLALLLSEYYSSAYYHEANSQGFIQIFLWFSAQTKPKATGIFQTREWLLSLIIALVSNICLVMHINICTFTDAKILRFWFNCVQEHALSPSYKSTSEILNFYTYISQAESLWLKIPLCYQATLHCKPYHFLLCTRIPWIFEICTSAMIYEVFLSFSFYFSTEAGNIS